MVRPSFLRGPFLYNKVNKTGSITTNFVKILNYGRKKQLQRNT